jgi:hypothetical protein
MNGTTLRSYASSGVCSAGACTYSPSNMTCTAPAHATASCADAACGFTCNSGYEPSGSSCVPTSPPGNLTFEAVVSTGTTSDLHAVWGSGPNDVYAVGDNVIVHSTDGGSTWVATTVSQTLDAVWGAGPNEVYAGGTTLVESIDGGKTWTQVNSAGPNAGWSAGPGDLFVGTAGLEYSSDGGVSLSGCAFASVDFPIVLAVWGAGPNDVYASVDNINGSTALIVHTTDHAQTCNTYAPPAGSGFDGISTIWGSSAADVYAAGTSGVFHSTDSGMSWTQVGASVPVFGSGAATGMWGSAANDIYMVTSSGAQHSTNGTTWTSIAASAGTALYGVWGSSGSDVYMVGMGGVILHGH